MGAIRAPSVLPILNPAAPTSTLSLKWVHGYTCGTLNEVRISANLRYNKSGNPVFPAASLGVILDLDRKSSPGAKKQKHFTGHNDDVLCLAISDDRCVLSLCLSFSVSLFLSFSLYIYSLFLFLAYCKRKSSS